MAGVEAVQAFRDEVDAAITDANQAQAETYPNCRVVTNHEVNGVEYFQHAVADNYGQGELQILARGMRFASRRGRVNNRVSIATSVRTPEEPEDQLVRTVEFGYDRDIGLFVPGGIVKSILDEALTEEALFVAQTPHRSTLARRVLAQLSEDEESQFETWSMAADRRAIQLFADEQALRTERADELRARPVVHDHVFGDAY